MSNSELTTVEILTAAATTIATTIFLVIVGAIFIAAAVELTYFISRWRKYERKRRDKKHGILSGEEEE